MAEFNTQYYQGQDRYSDGDIEETILEIVRSERLPDEKAGKSFPVLYHLSHLRENILSWYEFRDGASVLEIGAGAGAITGLLCRKCAHVTSVELSKRRATINYERHKDCENLTIMVGNLNDMEFPEPFDYVILNGVFEYAGSFTEGEDPYGTFLRRCKSYLKEDGLLLIAIENRLGLKYFSGATEDHTENYMEGLKNYPDNSSVHTFSRAEWEKLCDRCALPFRKFYFPYPDYKFPNEIFTEETISADGFGRNNWNFNPRRVELFSEQEMGAALCREGVMACFMNSFLIEAGRFEPAWQRGDVLYARISADRAEQFRIQTVILRGEDGEKYAVKSALSVRGQEHIQRMYERAEKMDAGLFAGDGAGDACAGIEDGAASAGAGGADASGNMYLLRGRMRPDGSVVYPFLNEQSLEEMACGGADEVRSVIDMTEDLLEPFACEGAQLGESFTQLFGPVRPEGELTMVSPANIDMILDNLFLCDGKVCVIDGEWITDTPVPKEFLIWRAVNELYSTQKHLEKILPQAQLLKEHGIDASLRQVFWQWATHFEKEYVGANKLAQYALPVRKADLKDLMLSSEDVRLTATLYLDRGKGYNETDAVHTDLVLEKGRYDVTFLIDHPEMVRSMRFDPLEGAACVCSLSCQEAALKPVNASARGKNAWVFLTTDPAFRVASSAVPGKLTIRGKVEIKSIEWALAKSQELLKKSRMGVLGPLKDIAGKIKNR